MIKSKLLFMSTVPLFFVIVLSSMLLYDVFAHKANLELTKNRILEAKVISNVVHFMQIERGLTAGLIASNKPEHEDTLFMRTRAELDEAIHEAQLAYSRSKETNIYILDILNEINRDRKNIDLLNLSIYDARNYYTKNIALLLNFIKTIPAMMDDRENRNFIQAYSYLSSAKESLGRIRATLMEVFTTNVFLDTLFISTKEYLNIYSLDIENFKIIASKQLLDYHNANFNDETTKEIFKLIKRAVTNKNSNDFNVQPSIWFEISTKSIGLLKKTEDRLFEDVSKLINEKLDSINYKITILIAFLSISAIIITILMIVAIKKILSSTSTLEQEYNDSLLLLGQYKQTVDRSFIVSKTDADGIITYVNDEFCRISGYTRDELLGKAHELIRHPQANQDIIKDMWHTIQELKQPWSGELKNISKIGLTYWQRAIINPILDNKNNIIEYIGIRTDITQQKEIEKYFENQLKVSNKNFDASMHLSKEYEKAIDLSTILSRTDKYGNITYVNDEFCKISGYALEALLGKSHNIIGSTDTPKETYKDIWSTISKGNVWRGVIKNISKSKKEFWTQTTIIPIKDLSNDIIEYLAIRYDITEIFLQRKEFERVANTDVLTGCGNRYRLNNEMQELDNLSVAIFNIDNFRQINDFYGHQFGDLIIKSIADKIYKQIAQEEKFKFYRLQGDEFIALAVNYSQNSLIEKVKNILDVIKEKFMLQDEEILISCSCGISFEDKEYLLSSANMALKVAKKSNIEYLVYNESISLNHEYENNIKWTKKLSNAIKNDNLITYYQPIVNNSNLVYGKYECLIRMKDADEIISPYFFLDIAKQTRQYFDITKTVIAQSFETFKNTETEFSINLSIMDILEENMSEYILMMLEKYGIGSRVVFEIVESEYIKNFQGALNFINKVRKYECKIAIDDFGTGYSNFEYLIKLKADYLKIDGSLVKNLNSDKNAFIVVSTIVDFSKKLGMKTIAEFVENEEIFNIVKELGIDYSQGYHFSEPKEKI